MLVDWWRWGAWFLFFQTRIHTDFHGFELWGRGSMSSRAGGGRLSKAKTGSWGATFVLASSSHPAPTSLPVFRPRACSEGGRGTEKKNNFGRVWDYGAGWAYCIVRNWHVFIWKRSIIENMISVSYIVHYDVQRRNETRSKAKDQKACWMKFIQGENKVQAATCTVWWRSQLHLSGGACENYRSKCRMK